MLLLLRRRRFAAILSQTWAPSYRFGRCTSREYRPRKVKAISAELCGHSFSASAISGFNEKLDEELGRFAHRKLESEYPYLILDARYEKVRENAVIRSRAVLVAIGIDWEGWRQMLGVEMANREFHQLERLSARAQRAWTAGHNFRGQ